MDIEERRRIDRERKKEARKNNTPYAQRQREKKRSEKAKKRRKELRQRPEQKEKERLYIKEYRQRDEPKKKEKARTAARHALVTGKLKRPDNCELCGGKDIPLRDGRSSLRMDHHKGYEKENHLNVIFVCVVCDGKQLRRNYDSPVKPLP